MRRVITLFVFTMWGVAFGQNQTATVTGQVNDQGGAAVPGAKVQVTNQATNVVREAQTNEDGQYTIPLLPPGTYSVSAVAPNLRKEVKTGIVLQIGDESRFDFALSVGDTSQAIEVQAAAPVVSTEDATVGDVIDNRKVVEMPLNGRLFWDLALLVPGVNQDPTSNGVRGGMDIMGQSDGANYYTYDGINNVDFSIGEPSFRPSIDSIEEFKVYTGTYEAEFGHNAGGQIVVVGKSGSNAFHGTLYEFLRNQTLDAVNFFNPPGLTPEYKRNQFGGTFGGPIRKNKTFFFFGYEGLRLRQQVTALTTVPTAAMLDGDFQGLPVTLQAPAGYAPNAVVNNVVNPSAFTPAQLQSYKIAQALLAYYPAPTRATAPGAFPANNYNYSATAQESSNQYNLRLDHTFNQTNIAYVTLNYFNDNTINYLTTDGPCSALIAEVPGFGCLAGVLAQVYGGGFTHIFTPNVVNDFHGGYQREVTPRYGVGPVYQMNFDQTYGLQANCNCVSHGLGIPNVDIAGGFSTLGTSVAVPQYRADNTFDENDTLIWTFGKHSIKFGVESTRLQNNAYVDVYGPGFLNFTNSNEGPTTGYAFSDALLGLPATTTRYYSAPPVEFRISSFSGFVQDSYKVSSRLTLNYGLRWENTTPLTNKYSNSMVNFNPVTAEAYDVPSSTNVYKYYNGWAPRFGFAYQLFGEKTVLRGGVGVFYNAPILINDLLNLETSYPDRLKQNFVSTPSTPLSLPNVFTGSPVGAASPAGIAPDFRVAAINEWSIGIQHEILRNLVLDVSYVGNHGSHLIQTINLNQPPPTALSQAAVQSIQPYPQYSPVLWYQSQGISNYDALLVRLEKRFSNGLSFITTYSYSKSLDDISQEAEPQNDYNIRGGNYGLSSYDVRQRFVWSPIWELPVGPDKHFLADGLASKIFGGFQLSSIVTIQTGIPVTPVLYGNYSNTNNQLLGTIDRPNATGINPNQGAHTLQEWFNTAAFAAPAFGTFGNAGVGTITSPGLVNFDIGLSRVFDVTEKMKLQFRGETFNTLNHPQFLPPNVIENIPTFGTISGANAPREIQVALKLIF